MGPQTTTNSKTHPPPKKMAAISHQTRPTWLSASHSISPRRSVPPPRPTIHVKLHPKSHDSINPCKTAGFNSLWRAGRPLTPLCDSNHGTQEVGADGGGDDKGEGGGKDDGYKGDGNGNKQPLETVQRLYNSIKDRDIEGLSELIGEECRRLPAVGGPLEGNKTQVLELFSMLMRSMGDNVVFVVKPSFENGMDITVEWQLEWEKTGTPMGKGYSFYTVHVYKGKVVFRNVEMIMEPLLQMEPLRLKLIGFFMPVDGFTSRFIVDKKVRMVIFFCLLVAILVSIILFNSL